MSPVFALNLALKFLLELSAFAGLACSGATMGPSAARPVLATALPLAAAAVWSVWAAPKSRKRLSRGPRTAVELSVFTAALAALLATGGHLIAAAFTVLVLINTPVAIAFERFGWGSVHGAADDLDGSGSPAIIEVDGVLDRERLTAL